MQEQESRGVLWTGLTVKDVDPIHGDGPVVNLRSDLAAPASSPAAGKVLVVMKAPILYRTIGTQYEMKARRTGRSFFCTRRFGCYRMCKRSPVRAMFSLSAWRKRPISGLYFASPMRLRSPFGSSWKS